MSVPFAVLRHASTDWNVERRLQGLTDTPLNAAGEAEARTWRMPSPGHGWRGVRRPLPRAENTVEAPITVPMMRIGKYSRAITA